MTNNKKLIIAVGAIAGLAIFAFLYVTFWSQPTKKDFVEAKVLAEKISNVKGTKSFQDFAAAVSGAAKENKSYEQIVEASKDEKAALVSALNSRSENAALLDKSRVLKDEEVKKVHTTYANKEKTYNSFLKSYADAYPSYYSSFNTCIKIYEIARQTNDEKVLAKLHTEASKDCLEDLKVLSASSFKPLADYAKENTRIVNGRQKALDSFAAGKITSDAASQTLKQLSADNTKNDPIDNIKALQEKSIFNGELTTLITLLGKKAEQAK